MGLNYILARKVYLNILFTDVTEEFRCINRVQTDMEFKRSRFLILICLLLTPTGSEPVCSKFAYEEQLLEKMVRMEFNVGQMEREIKNTKSLVLESLERLKQEWEKVTKGSEAMKTEIRKVLEETEEKVSNEIENARAERAETLKDYKEKLGKFRAEAVVPNIAFNARTPSSLDPVDDAVIVFTKTIVNIGNAYDNATGMFTAPIDGTYLFTSQLCLQKGKWITFGIYVEEIAYIKSRYYGSGEGEYVCFNVQTTVVMKTNQKASVKSWDAATGEILLENVNDRWNIFSGTLIHK